MASAIGFDVDSLDQTRQLPHLSGTETPISTYTPNLPSSQLYASLPLPPHMGKIRVLDLDACDANTKSLLTGTLRLVDLKDRPKFAALSYVWGKELFSQHAIRCNGYSIEITRNCHEALMSLRNLFGSITIWVDSICIDQSNIPEKTTQLLLMENIYTSAHPTYIWLGEGSESAYRAMDCIELATRLRVPPIAVPWFHDRNLVAPVQDRQALVWAICKAWMSNFCCTLDLRCCYLYDIVGLGLSCLI